MAYRNNQKEGSVMGHITYQEFKKQVDGRAVSSVETDRDVITGEDVYVLRYKREAPKKITAVLVDKKGFTRELEVPANQCEVNVPVWESSAEAFPGTNTLPILKVVRFQRYLTLDNNRVEYREI
jgi:hypothetical protein